MTNITMEEIAEAHKWLAENPNAWENFGGFRLLAPLDQVPEVVIRYCKFEEENTQVLEQQTDILESMDII